MLKSGLSEQAVPVLHIFLNTPGLPKIINLSQERVSLKLQVIFDLKKSLIGQKQVHFNC